MTNSGIYRGDALQKMLDAHKKVLKDKLQPMADMLDDAIPIITGCDHSTKALKLIPYPWGEHLETILAPVKTYMTKTIDHMMKVEGEDGAKSALRRWDKEFQVLLNHKDIKEIFRDGKKLSIDELMKGDLRE